MTISRRTFSNLLYSIQKFEKISSARKYLSKHQNQYGPITFFQKRQKIQGKSMLPTWKCCGHNFWTLFVQKFWQHDNSCTYYLDSDEKGLERIAREECCYICHSFLFPSYYQYTSANLSWKCPIALPKKHPRKIEAFYFVNVSK